MTQVFEVSLAGNAFKIIQRLFAKEFCRSAIRARAFIDKIQVQNGTLNTDQAKLFNYPPVRKPTDYDLVQRDESEGESEGEGESEENESDEQFQPIDESESSSSE